MSDWRKTFLAVAPYGAWMLLMFTLPATAVAYAVRTAVSGLLLLVGLALAYRRGLSPKEPGGLSPDRRGLSPRALSAVAWGLAVGAIVCVLWIYPERFEWYRSWCIIGDPTPKGPVPCDPAVCGWPLTWTRLFGSAVVIAAAEELFFRGFLYRRLQARDWGTVPMSRFDLSAFVWTVGLFALEHNRIFAGAMAGALYGLLAMRKGLGAAVLAHMTTNLALGLYVIKTGSWAFW